LVYGAAADATRWTALLERLADAQLIGT
jgi:hypothetical protein